MKLGSKIPSHLSYLGAAPTPTSSRTSSPTPSSTPTPTSPSCCCRRCSARRLLFSYLFNKECIKVQAVRQNDITHVVPTYAHLVQINRRFTLRRHLHTTHVRVHRNVHTCKEASRSTISPRPPRHCRALPRTTFDSPVTVPWTVVPFFNSTVTVSFASFMRNLLAFHRHATGTPSTTVHEHPSRRLRFGTLAFPLRRDLAPVRSDSCRSIRPLHPFPWVRSVVRDALDEFHRC